MTVPTVVYYSMVLSVAIVVSAGPVVEDYTDLIEFNHVHDCKGNPIFDQVIAWKWYRDENKYHVRVWKMFEAGDTPPKCNYSSGLYSHRWCDNSRQRIVVAKYYRESWTQFDPERADLVEIPADARQSLRKR